MIDDAHDPLLIATKQAAVGAHGDLSAALAHGDGDGDRRALDAQQVAGHFGDDVAVLLPDVADRCDAHRASGLHVLDGDCAVGVPLRRHAIVAQLIQQILSVLVAGQHFEHAEVEGRGSVQERAGVGVDTQGRRGTALRAQLVEQSEARAENRHEGRG